MRTSSRSGASPSLRSRKPDFCRSHDAVQEIRSTDSLAGAASEIEHPQIASVRHTIQRGRRAYYVVNAASHFSLPVTRPALLLIMRNARTAVLIDRIERMAEISRVYPLPNAFVGQEKHWYRGLAYADDHVIPVIDPSALLSSEYIRIWMDTANPLCRVTNWKEPFAHDAPARFRACARS